MAAQKFALILKLTNLDMDNHICAGVLNSDTYCTCVDQLKN